MVVPTGWATDLEVRRLSGAVIEQRPGFTVVRSPRNPGFHWGNFVLVWDRDLALAVGECLEAFAEEFPGADHVAIGLPDEPAAGPWRARGLAVESELVLVSDAPCAATPPAAGYQVGALVAPADWAALVAHDLAGDAQDVHRADPQFRRFVARRAEERAELSARGVAAFFGAFRPGAGLVAVVGVVLCGPVSGARQVARFQHVSTAEEHRSRGLATHLLGRAAAWAAERGADRWEIHVEPATAAHRLYAGLGFGPAGRTWQVYRAAP